MSKTAQLNQLSVDTAYLRDHWFVVDPQGKCTTISKHDGKASISSPLGRITHFMGLGPAGYYTVNSAIRQLAKDCLTDIARPVTNLISKINRYQPLSESEKELLSRTVNQVSEITRQESSILGALSANFSSKKWLHTASLIFEIVFGSLLGVPNFTFRMFFGSKRTSEEVLLELSQNKFKRMELLGTEFLTTDGSTSTATYW